MRRSVVRAVSMCLVVATLAGCAGMRNKFTFMRPDLSRKDFTRTAPEYSIRPDDDRRAGASVARGHVARSELRLRQG